MTPDSPGPSIVSGTLNLTAEARERIRRLAAARCPDCGLVYQGPGHCPDCGTRAVLDFRSGKVTAFLMGQRLTADADFVADCVADCGAEEYLRLSPEQQAADAARLGARAMERRDVITPAEAGAYGLGIHEEPRE